MELGTRPMEHGVFYTIRCDIANLEEDQKRYWHDSSAINGIFPQKNNAIKLLPPSIRCDDKVKGKTSRLSQLIMTIILSICVFFLLFHLRVMLYAHYF